MTNSDQEIIERYKAIWDNENLMDAYQWRLRNSGVSRDSVAHVQSSKAQKEQYVTALLRHEASRPTSPLSSGK